MRILLTTDVIHAGGAETFVLRLGQALTKQGHHVVIYPLYKNRIDFTIINTLAPDVHVIPSSVKFLRFVQILDGFLRRVRRDCSLLNYFFSRHMASVVKRESIAVIHSHLFTADIVAVHAGKQVGVPVVTTIHGDYSANDRASKKGELKRILNFPKKMVAVLSQMKSIVCICEEQLLFFKTRESTFEKGLPVTKIYNGFDRPQINAQNKVTRALLGIPEDAFVFCMVARGIPEKGWDEAITAIKQLGKDNSFLLLIGDSDYVQSLRTKYESNNIKFLGKQEQPFLYLLISDVGLFCSKIKTEALPTVIIEYLAAGLPVICTDVGETKLMIQGSIGPAGVIVDSEEAELSSRLCGAMGSFYNDPVLLKQFKANTEGAFEQFKMNDCVRRYEEVYKMAVQ